MQGPSRIVMGALAAAAMVMGLLAAPAYAVPPANDTIDGAVVIGPSPFSHTQSTVEAAQTDPFESSLNEFCGAPVVEHGVWFTATPTEDADVLVDVTGSDYAAGIMVFAGDPTPEGLLTCGPGQVAGTVLAGTTYNLLVFGDGLTEATSGNLVLEVIDAPPAPTIDVTVNQRAQLTFAGGAVISGTATCTAEDGVGELIDVFGSVSQWEGQTSVVGFFGTFLGAPCDGTTVPWEAVAPPEGGQFRAGKAMTIAIAFGCSEILCAEGFIEATVLLQ